MEDEDPNKILKIIDKELTRVKHASFGKIKISSKTKEDRELEDLQIRKMNLYKNANELERDRKIEEIDAAMSNVLKTIQSKQYSQDIKNLEEIKNKKGRAAANFKLKEKILVEQNVDRNLS